MPHNWWTRKRLVLILAFVSLACVVSLVAAGLTVAEPLPGTEIGPHWHCSRLAFVFTVCSRVSQAEPTLARVAKEPVCRRPRA